MIFFPEKLFPYDCFNVPICYCCVTVVFLLRSCRVTVLEFSKQGEWAKSD